MDILKVNYNNITLNKAVERSMELLKSNKKSNIFFLNIDCLRQSQKDKEYRDIMRWAECVFPDGVGIKIASRICGGSMKDNCNGTDLSPLLFEKFAKGGFKMFLLGGAPGIARQAAVNLRRRMPDVQIVGTHHGYMDEDETVIDQINKSGADVLFVAMGVPIQEKWIHRNRGRLDPKLCLGVGALLDYLSGSIPRAPKFFRFLSMEWLWRCFVNPKRMIRRYFVNDLGFLTWLIFHRIKTVVFEK
ncbi:MAG: WecB/TagA/CpsF family glycosyltransferase [Candidatus Omnitrophica bacterium]|nr:WecB/TagA/CpsF family glycosyltransferase [Candidatus Omnitrophota bacterium]